MTASPAPSHPQHPPEQPHPIPPVPRSRLTSPGRCGAARPALCTSWHAAASLGCEKKGAGRGRLRLALRPGSPAAGFIASAAGPPPAPPAPSRRSWPRPPRALVFSSGGLRGEMCVPGVRPGDGSARAELRFGELQGSREVSSRWCVRLLGKGGGWKCGVEASFIFLGEECFHEGLRA